MSAALRIVIYQPNRGGDYHCSRLLGDANLPTPNILFEKSMELGQEPEDVEEAVKEECRKRGIARVVNLEL